MSYTNETTHYSIPKPLGTDLTVPMDYNDAADAIDQALFDASTNATEAVTAAANAVEAAAEAVEDVGDLGTEVNNLKGRTSALEATEIIQNNKIDNLENQGATKFDSAGIADPYVNGLTYAVGDVITYNGQRYKCTTAVVAAEPFDADKWSAEDVETVLNDIKSDLIELSTPISAEFRNGTYTTSTQQISDAITLSTGTYLIMVKLPVATITTYSVTDGSNILNKSFIEGGTYASLIFPYVVPSGSKTLYVQLSSNIECSISYKERGYFTAIKLG